MTKKLCVVVLLGVLATGYTHAGLIFDNTDPGGGRSNRAAESSPGALLDVTTTTTISNISVLNELAGAGEMKFLIFDHPSHVLLYESPPQPFGADAASTWKMSDFLSFTLLAGNSYDIGAIANVPGFWNFDTTSNSQNGITSVVANPNFSNFAAPVQAGHAGADAAVRLYTSDVLIPEPASLSLLGLGLLVAARKRRKR